ncbi:OFA family MFS transporter [Christensenella tenuis]|jgi:MFS transporter, OFA family, oxalate/formate antiporter|uniref:OFA family MFS transporter n=1 Tax=Christensenella tenuis TaxID=2763033 RepID=A0ABR7EHT9_9FIRM|nr:OFA family MFS transporter [Christensenella tenuis]MBC5649308.1 OFA family MFS transporter [Christensenella tenuis]
MGKKENKALPLVAGAVIQLCIGIIYIWSIFQPAVMEYYSWSAADASVTFSIMLATFVLGIVAGGRINDKKGPRPVVFLGGILFCAGIFLSSFVPREMPQLIWLFYGGLAGFGVGAAYTSTISCAQKWFMDKKGFATGVIVCTFGASTVVFTPVVNTLLKTAGVSQTFFTLSIIFLAVILVFGWFVKNPSREYMDKFEIALPDLSRQKQYTPGEVLKTKYYYFIFLSMLLLTPAYFIINPLLKSLGELRSLTEAAALAGVMATGMASAAGRLLAPWLSDRIGRRNVLFLLYGITLVSILLLTFAQSYFFIVLIALVSFAFGGSAGVYPAVTADYFGIKNNGVNYGLVMIAFAVSGLLFPAIAKVVTPDGIPSAWTFLVPAIASVAGILITLALKKDRAKKATT